MGNSVLAAALLVLPIRGLESRITPYVQARRLRLHNRSCADVPRARVCACVCVLCGAQLTDMKALSRPSYICGSSNPVMVNMRSEYRTPLAHTPRADTAPADMWDVVAITDKGTVEDQARQRAALACMFFGEECVAWRGVAWRRSASSSRRRTRVS